MLRYKAIRCIDWHKDVSLMLVKLLIKLQKSITAEQATLSNIHDSRDLSSIDRLNISTLFKTTLDVIDGNNSE